MDNFFEKLERLGISKSGFKVIVALLVASALIVVLVQPQPAAVPQAPAKPQISKTQPGAVQSGAAAPTTR